MGAGRDPAVVAIKRTPRSWKGRAGDMPVMRRGRPLRVLLLQASSAWRPQRQVRIYCPVRKRSVNCQTIDILVDLLQCEHTSMR